MTENENLDKNLDKNFDKKLDSDITKKLKEILQNDTVLTKILPDFDIPIYTSKSTLEKNMMNIKKKKILVMSGGGIKGIAHVGILKALEDLNSLNNFDTFAGASVGSLMIALYTIGYKPTELLEFITKFDLENMKTLNIFNIFQNFGLDSGVRIEYVVKRLIEAKGVDPNITLFDLYELTKKTVIFTSVCLNTIEVEYLSHKTHPNLPFYKAIKMSFSIPWYYFPVEHDGYLYVDGGCIDNYPIQHFSDRLDEVIGVYLIQSKDVINRIDNFETFTLRVFQCFMEGVNFNSKKGYEKYTVDVKVDVTNFVDYGISIEQKQKIFEAGYNSMINYVKN